MVCVKRMIDQLIEKDRTLIRQECKHKHKHWSNHYLTDGYMYVYLQVSSSFVVDKT